MTETQLICDDSSTMLNIPGPFGLIVYILVGIAVVVLGLLAFLLANFNA